MIGPILQRSFALLSGSLLLSAACRPFALPEWKERIFFDSFVWTGANVALQIALSPLDAKAAQAASNWLFALDAQKGHNLVHEMGHWIAAKLLINKPPTLKLNHTHGLTTYCPNELSPLGRRLGQRASVCMTTMAGPLLDVFATSALFAAGLALRSSYPSMSSAILWSSGMNFTRCIAYPLSAFIDSDLSNDYVLLHRLITE